MSELPGVEVPPVAEMSAPQPKVLSQKEKEEIVRTIKDWKSEIKTGRTKIENNGISISRSILESRTLLPSRTRLVLTDFIRQRLRTGAVVGCLITFDR